MQLNRIKLQAANVITHFTEREATGKKFTQLQIIAQLPIPPTLPQN